MRLQHVLTGALWITAISGWTPFVSPETVPSLATEQGDEQVQTCIHGQCSVIDDNDVDVEEDVDVDVEIDDDADREADVYYKAAVRYVNIDFGETQQVAGETWRETIASIERTIEYMNVVRNNRTFDSVRAHCRCRHELCGYWAAIGMFSSAE